jgi:glycerophosphoryl diester phosphodiesterase
MKYIAHRGYSKTNRDNTVISIREAIHRKYDGVEIDVQLCKSGEIVLYHDVYIDNYFVRDLTYRELSDKGVYSLIEVYDVVPDLSKTMVIIDMKGNDIALCDALKVFYEKRTIEQVYFCSFNRNLIYSLPDNFLKGSTFETTFKREEFEFVCHNLDALVLHWTCLDKNLIHYCKTRTKPIKIFTYTHKEDMEINYMLKFDVDGIVTNGIQ